MPEAVSLNVVHAGFSLANWTVEFISVDATSYSPSVGVHIPLEYSGPQPHNGTGLVFIRCVVSR